MSEKILPGRVGEEIAFLFLKLKGYHILGRNLRTRRSELDIVAKRDGCLAFVEVKLRGRGSVLRPVECVDKRKRERLTRGATLFLQNLPVDAYNTVRFDVIAITCTEETLVVEHIEDAFAAEGLTGW